MTALTRLDIRLLGAPRIEHDGVPLAVDTRKAIALLAYLAVTRQPHTRDALATLLWPESGQAEARGALRRTLSVLNKALQGRWLIIEREQVALHFDDQLFVDVQRFQQQTQAAARAAHCAERVTPLREAAVLYRDDFLAGFSLRDSANFDEWQFFQSESLRRELAVALESLAHCLAERGDHTEAIAQARRWLALDPLHEPAHRLLMQLYAATGQRAAALRQYHECVRLLESELGVAPQPETTALYERLQKNAKPADPVLAHSDETRSAQPPANQPALIPLVGREREWQRVRQAYDAVRADGHLIVVEGEAGIGKTRLAEELLQHARGRGARVLSARCYEGEGSMAYAPFVEGLRALLAEKRAMLWLDNLPRETVAEAARLLPELARIRTDLPTLPALDSPGAQTRFFDGLHTFMLAALHANSAPIFFLDDAQWADSASLDLFTYLARRLRGHAWCLLATWRSEDAPPAHRLRALLADVERAGLATAVPLARLTQAAVAELAQSVGDVPPTLYPQLYAETEGLPFFVMQYLAALAQDDGAPTLPSGVRDLLRSRLRNLSASAQQVLMHAAVIGRSFEFETLRAVSERADAQVVEALEELLRRGLIAEVQAAGDALRYDFSHEQLRALVYAEISQARRVLLHRRVADVLAAQGTAALASTVAYHAALAGQRALAAEQYKVAGDYARSLYANAEALHHYQRALELGHADAATLQEALGDLQTLAGNYAAALHNYESASERAETVQHARLMHKRGNVYLRRGDAQRAEACYEHALDASQADNLRARILADWSQAAYQRGELTRARERGELALQIARETGDERAQAQAHNALGIIARARQQHALAQAQFAQSLRVADQLADEGARAAALNNLALVARESGDPHEAIALTTEALRLCARQGDRHREAALHNNLADLLHAQGRGDAAMEHLKQAVTIFAEIGANSEQLQPEIWKLTEW